MHNHFIIMKFFEYLVCCTCSSSSISEASPSLQAGDFKALDPVLQPESHVYRNRRKCSIRSQKSSSATADWRPSLKAISEDDIVAAKSRHNSTSSERTLERKVSPMHKSKVPTRRSQDYGGAPIPGIIPAFAPTPFLF